MSKLAKIPVNMPEGINAVLENNTIKISGPKGNLSFRIPEGVGIKAEDKRLTVSLRDSASSRSSGLREASRSNQELKPSLGLTRAMIFNMVKGVSSGFEKKLELSGVGYRAQVAESGLNISVGFSHPVRVAKVDGITFSIAENIITVSGIDKNLVGDVSSRIRNIRPPEPYKGKGIKYQDEIIRRKVGKAAKALGTK